MKIGRIEISDENGHLIAWYANGIWYGLTSVIPQVINIMVMRMRNPMLAFQKAIAKLPKKDDRTKESSGA